MAASRTTSNSPDWEDLAMLIDALENLHGVQVTMSIRRPERGKTGLFVLIARAERVNAADGVVVRSVSRSMPIGSRDPIQVCATMFQVLYGLDRDCGSMWIQEAFLK